MKKCFVTGCDSVSSQSNDLLFQTFPSTKQIALKWLKNLENFIPNLIYEPVQKICICEKHFENRFRSKCGTITSDAYPTLLTPKEIVTGVPENFDDYQIGKDYNYTTLKEDKSDHTYAVKDAPENSNKFKIWKKTIPQNIVKAKSDITDISKNATENVALTDNASGQPISCMVPSTSKGNTQLQHTRHSLTVDKSTINKILPIKGPITNGYRVKYVDTETDFNNDIAIFIDNDVNNQKTKDASGQPISCMVPSTSKGVTVDKPTIINKSLPLQGAPKILYKIGNPMMKLIDSSKILQAKYKQSLLQVKRLKRMVKLKNERIKKLSKFDRKTYFDRLTKHVDNPLTKKLIWMQVKRAPTKAKGRRFTDEEKAICTYIRNQNSQCYRILRKIFTLPSPQSLFRYLKAEMAPKNTVDSTTS